MKRFQWAILVFSTIVLVIFLLGFALPERILVETETKLEQQPEDVLNFLADLHNWKNWSQISTWYNPELEISYSGAPSGVGAIMTWKGENLGGGEIKITRITQMPVLHYSLKPESSDFLFDCKFEIRKIEGENASNLRWVVVTDLGLNPVMRYAGLALKSSLKNEIENDIQKLKRVLDK